MFSKKFGYDIEENRLSTLLSQKKKSGIEVIDLTISNPTSAGFNYDKEEILKSISREESLIYSPNANGLKEAREAVRDYYREKNIDINHDNIFLTSGTSEAYGFIFKLITNPYDEILIPRPSYPLLQYICEMESVSPRYYNLDYTNDGFWEIDFESIKSNINKKTKVLILVNPNNPTGNYLKSSEIESLISICKEHGIALIIDEVFNDYNIEPIYEENNSFLKRNDILNFTLNGLSKVCGLPQMKLSWILINGDKKMVEDAKSRFEIITDTYLSVGTPIQYAVSDLLKHRYGIQKQIIDRIKFNYEYIKSVTTGKNNISVLNTEGGWYSILKIHKDMDEEKLVYNLLDKKDIYVHPGYFFDFKEGTFLILSLLTPHNFLKEGLSRVIEFIELQ